MYKYVLFDLDGTLTDPQDGILKCIAYALERLETSVPDRRTMLSFIGPPLFDTFTSYFGFDAEKAELAIKYYRERFSTVGLYENSVYDGVHEMLASLKKNGAVLALATSKPEAFAVKIADHFGMSQYFDLIVGATMDGSLSQKKDIIDRALSLLCVTDKSQCVMVGDRKHDAMGAHACSIRCIGVLYGYGSRRELTGCGVDALAIDCRELEALLTEYHQAQV